MLNPFVIVGYHGPEYFCDREEETERILNAIRHKRNLVLLAQRRMGKTGLIEHVFQKSKLARSYTCVYLDLLPCTDLASMAREFGRELIGKVETKPEKLLRNIKGMFKYLNPVIRYDSVSGDPSVEFQISDHRHPEYFIGEILQYLDSKNERIVIALDEFQQIASFPEKNVQSILRSEIQKCRNLSFIFSGSQQHILSAMFTQHNKPFYQSAEIIALERINEKVYEHFIARHFKSKKITITAEAIKTGLQLTDRHTWYTQYLFHKLFASGLKTISKDLVLDQFAIILKENETIYAGYRNLLTNNQWNLLIAIGHEKKVEKPLSKNFIAKYKLGSSSSVQTSLKKLNEQEMIYYENGEWKIYDLFFSNWIQQWSLIT